MPLNEVQLALVRQRQAQSAVPVLRATGLEREVGQREQRAVDAAAGQVAGLDVQPAELPLHRVHQRSDIAGAEDDRQVFVEQRLGRTARIAAARIGDQQPVQQGALLVLR